MRLFVLVAIVLASCGFTPAFGGQADGFTEPYRTIDVAAEMGIIASLDVREGDRVRQGQVLAKLDQDVLLASLEIARTSMEAQGKLAAAAAEVELRKARVEKLETLRASGNARQEEVDRARADLAIAQANVLAAQEEQAVRKLEFERIKVQLERRIVRSPIDGVVTKIHRDEGEFVAANMPHVVTVVQLNTLLAAFSIPAPQAIKLRVNQDVRVSFADVSNAAPGTIEFISPVIDAESGTVRVKVRIDNTDGVYRSGERCSILLPDTEPRPTPARATAKTR